MSNYLGLDLGTSSLKALLIGDDQRVIASASVPLSVERPQFGWSEQDPQSWIAACETALGELSDTHGRHRPVRTHARRDAAGRG